MLKIVILKRVIISIVSGILNDQKIGAQVGALTAQVGALRAQPASQVRPTPETSLAPQT